MKRSIIALTLLTLVATVALGQTKRNDSVEAQIVALEKSAFEAWMKKDRKFFEDHMSEDAQYLDLNGVGGKAQYVKAIIDNDCKVSRYSLDNTKVTMLSNDVALLTFDMPTMSSAAAIPKRAPCGPPPFTSGAAVSG